MKTEEKQTFIAFVYGFFMNAKQSLLMEYFEDNLEFEDFKELKSLLDSIRDDLIDSIEETFKEEEYE